jgi:hypothetical protein
VNVASLMAVEIAEHPVFDWSNFRTTFSMFTTHWYDISQMITQVMFWYVPNDKATGYLYSSYLGA